MEEMAPSSCIMAMESDCWTACERAFEYAVRFRGGRDLVEEFVAARVWPLGRNTWKNFNYERVRLPIFGIEEG